MFALSKALITLFLIIILPSSENIQSIVFLKSILAPSNNISLPSIAPPVAIFEVSYLIP